MSSGVKLEYCYSKNENITYSSVKWYNVRMASKQFNRTSPKNAPTEKLKILFVSPEVAPYSKVGGLADVAWALPRALRELGHDVRVFTPKFGLIDEDKFNLEPVMEGLKIQADADEVITCNVKKGNIPGDITVYLLENKEYYEIRANVYGYADDTRRWVLLCRGALEFLQKFDWTPDIIHANDWLTGFVPNDLATRYKEDEKLNKIATMFSIHNIANQGTFNYRTVSELDRDDGQSALPDLLSPKTLKLNGMRRGIIHSDIITTVSDTYAKQILDPEYGAGLDRLLRELRTKLYGVLNGLDYKVFNPMTDNDIWVNYDWNSIDKKVENKIAFQKEFGLRQDPDVPVIGFVGRFHAQKGIEPMYQAIEALLPVMDFQFIIVGSGMDNMENAFHQLMKKYPDRVGGHLMISKIIGQQIYASADMLLMPSKYEPCGLAQLIAMRYGTVPIVRNTGGLADTVIPYDPLANKGTGFMFNDFNSTSLMIQVVRALEVYRHKEAWSQLMRRAMEQDFSWENSASEYERLYHRAIYKRRKWLRKEGILMPEEPTEVPGSTVTTKEPLR